MARGCGHNQPDGLRNTCEKRCLTQERIPLTIEYDWGSDSSSSCWSLKEGKSGFRGVACCVLLKGGMERCYRGMSECLRLFKDVTHFL